MTKEERMLSEGVANLSEINRAYFLAVLRSLSFAPGALQRAGSCARSRFRQKQPPAKTGLKACGYHFIFCMLIAKKTNDISKHFQEVYF